MKAPRLRFKRGDRQEYASKDMPGRAVAEPLE
jgi:hypothetical protein